MTNSRLTRRDALATSAGAILLAGAGRESNAALPRESQCVSQEDPASKLPVLCISCSFRDAGDSLPERVELALVERIKGLNGRTCRLTPTTWFIATKLTASQIVNVLEDYFGKGDVLTVFPVAVGQDWVMACMPVDDRDAEDIDWIAVWMEHHIRPHSIAEKSTT